MIDRLTADTQRWLSYAFLAGYFGLKILEGLKWLAPVSADLKEALMVILLFWFMRSRQQENKTNA